MLLGALFGRRRARAGSLSAKKETPSSSRDRTRNLRAAGKKGSSCVCHCVSGVQGSFDSNAALYQLGYSFLCSKEVRSPPRLRERERRERLDVTSPQHYGRDLLETHCITQKYLPVIAADGTKAEDSPSCSHPARPTRLGLAEPGQLALLALSSKNQEVQSRTRRPCRCQRGLGAETRGHE